MSAARCKPRRPVGNLDWFDVIGRARPDCQQAQQAAAPRRPYNEWGKEGKFAPRRYLAEDLRRRRSREFLERLLRFDADSSCLRGATPLKSRGYQRVKH